LATPEASIERRNLQILANHCAAAADAMAFTLMRTAHSAFVKETEDFSCTILSAKGEAVASPRSFGAPWYSGIDYAPILRMIPFYEEGDICITNDPYSGNVATHSPDMHIWKPIFHEGRLICFVAGHIHNTDVGGAVPASLSRSLSDIAQEGIRIPPLKVMSRGVLNTDITRILETNVRAPEQNAGDLRAQIASVNIGERRISEIVRRFGADRFVAGLEDLLNYAQEQAAGVVAEMPEGEYFFSDYIDEDGEAGVPCRIALTLRIAGGRVELDYTGSDPQTASSLNMPTGGHERHPLVLVGLTYVLATLKPNILLNAGTLRIARAVLPAGTVVNADAPAAVGLRSLTCMMTQIVTFGAFAQALPGRIPASAPGGNAIMNLRTVGWDGRPVMASIGPVGGGGGGTPKWDGSNGAGGSAAFLKNTPIEISESEIQIHFRRYGLWPDSAGAGKYRGGLSAMMEFEVSAPDTIVTARNRNRSVFSSWGLAGGLPGALSLFVKNPDSPQQLSLGNADVVKCGPGDVIRVVGPGAGGYGHPYDRPPAAVLQDVRAGFVSVEAALRDYGVVIRDQCVDEAATLARRDVVRPPTEAVTFGLERRQLEQIWTPSRYDILTELLSEVPPSWRNYFKQRILRELASASDTDEDFGQRARRLISQGLASGHSVSGSPR
jgi:N-methylhydantoinase B